MWEFQATAISKHYLRFIITRRKNIFKQLSLTQFSVINLVIKVRQKAGVTKISFAVYKINQLPTKMWAAAFKYAMFSNGSDERMMNQTEYMKTQIEPSVYTRHQETAVRY